MGLELTLSNRYPQIDTNYTTPGHTTSKIAEGTFDAISACFIVCTLRFVLGLINTFKKILKFV